MRLTRRDLMLLAGAGAGTLVAGPLLSGCASSEPDTGAPVENAGSGTPRPGGTVTAAFTGGGPTESLDPFLLFSPADFARNLVVFDRLFVILDGIVTPELARSAETTPDGASFVLTLREDAVWHDGSPIVAADVAYSLAYLASTDRPYPSELSGLFDLTNVSVRGEHSLLIPTLQPVGDPAAALAGANAAAVVKEGTTSFAVGDFVGSGPYRVTSFEAGREARLARFDDHWAGEAYAEELVILSLDDPQARVNAVQGGQADYAADIPFTVARTGAGSSELEVRSAGERQRTGFGFVFNMTKPLMADERVRMAMRLGVNRQALVDQVFLGYGEPANDLFGYGAQYFAEDIPVLERDSDQARRLLEEAGAVGEPVVIRSADYELGQNASTELFVEQLRELGLDAQAQLVDVSEYFAADGIASSDAISFPLGPFPLGVIFTRSALFPELAFPDPELQEALSLAVSSTDEQERAQAWLSTQQVMADRGNWLVWGRGDILSLTRKDLVGIQVRDSAKYPYLGRAGFTS